MVTLSQIFDFTDLSPEEIIFGATPSTHHKSLLASYLFNLNRGKSAVRDLIVSDLRSALDIGAHRRAGDLLIVLRMFLVNELRVLGHLSNAENMIDDHAQSLSETGSTIILPFASAQRDASEPLPGQLVLIDAAPGGSAPEDEDQLSALKGFPQGR